jgi:hypothetical protein
VDFASVQRANQRELEELYKSIYLTYNAYGETKRTLHCLTRVLRGIEQRLPDNQLGVRPGSILENMHEIQTSRETTIANALQQLSTLMTFKVAVYTSETADSAKRDASSMTTYVTSMPEIFLSYA